MSTKVHLHDEGFGMCIACSDDFVEMRKQVAEMHAVIKALSEALNSPMLKAMLPPSVRGMLGG